MNEDIKKLIELMTIQQKESRTEFSKISNAIEMLQKDVSEIKYEVSEINRKIDGIAREFEHTNELRIESDRTKFIEEKVTNLEYEVHVLKRRLSN